MKVKLNLTIDKDLLFKIKKFAQAKSTSVSELVENYFDSIVQTTERKSIIDLVDQLESPDFNTEVDLIKTFYEKKSQCHRTISSPA